MKTLVAKLAAGAAFALAIVSCGGAGAPPTPAGPGGASTQPAPVASPGNPTPVAVSATQPPAAGPGASIDSCALLTDDEIVAGTGQRVLSREPSTLTQVFRSVCDVELDGGSLTVSVLPTGGRSMYECCFEPFIGEGDTPPLDEVVSGLGDKAAMSGDDNLMVLTDDVLFDIFYIAPGRPGNEATVRYLAEVVLSKLSCQAASCPGLTPPPAPPTATAVDICAVLTADDIESATGFAILETEPGTGIDAGCTWTLDTQPFPGADYIELTVKTPGGREQFDFIANEMFETPPEHVPGLGDDAVKTATIPAGAVHAVIGDRLVSLRFSLPLSVDDPYALVMPLMETALPRLSP